MVENEVQSKSDKSTLKSSGKTWEYFDVEDADRKLAQCKLCYQTLSYNTTVSNLMKHVRRTHPNQVFVTEDDADIENSRDNENHFIESSDDDDTEYAITPFKNKNTEKNKPKYRSKSWEYFVVESEENRVARCKLCNCKLSFNSGATNLMKHVRNKHSGRVSHLNDEADNDNLEDKKSDTDDIKFLHEEEADAVEHEITEEGTLVKKRKGERSMVWSYFEGIDRKKRTAVCLLCRKTLSYNNVSNLKKHLLRIHPGAVPPSPKTEKAIFFTAEDIVFAEQSNDEHKGNSDADEFDAEEMVHEYLEESNTEKDVPDPIRIKSIPNKRMKRKRRMFKDNKPSIKERLITEEEDSSEDEVTLRRRYVRRRYDSIDYFGKYMTSLLKQLPKEYSDQLQLDFMKQVIAVRMAIKNAVPNVLASDGYTITIATDHGGAVPEGATVPLDNTTKIL